MCTKSEYRAKMKELRKNASLPSPCERFFEADWTEKHVFFVYRSIASEADTSALIARLKGMGKIVLTPKVENGELFAVLDEGEERKGAFGIPERIALPYEGGIDVVLLPLLAVDKRGVRLGYGGGYYDRFLKNCSAERIGYCYSFQVVEELPFEAHDERVHRVCTEEGWIPIKG